MKFIFRLGLLTFFLAVFCFQFCIQSFAAEQKKIAPRKPVVAVISDTGHRNGTTYLICGAASDIIAEDLVNAINQNGHMHAPLLGDNMQKMTVKQFNLYKDTFFNEYKYNYNIDFVNLKRLTKNMGADYVLMVTSGLDVQSNFLKDTWWNKLCISGMDPVRPTYKLSTLITLIDLKTYNIMWQDLYLKDIAAHNYDLGIVQFSPSYAQLSKIKKYSVRVADHVVPIVDARVNPQLQPQREQKTVELKNVHLNEDKRLYYPVIHKEQVKKKWNNFQKKFEKEPYIENVSDVKKGGAVKGKEIPAVNVKTDVVKQELPSVTAPAIVMPQSPAVQQQKMIIKPVAVKKSTEQNVIKPAVYQTPVVDYKEPLPDYNWNIRNKYEDL